MRILANSISYDSDGIESIGALLNNTIGPTYTYNVRLDEDAGSDRTATFLGNLTEHIANACELIAAEPVLSTAPAVNAIGLSQGGLFLRGYIERCNYPPVKSLATFGSPHNGISEFQKCGDSGFGALFCAAWEGLLKTQTWTSFVQSTLVPAQYYRDPEKLDEYLENSNWLADINNEREIKNGTYKTNLKSLENFWMYKFSEDTTVVPPETEWFQDISGEGENRTVIPLKERQLYKEDWLGLKALDERNALQFKVAEGGHMQISDEELFDVFEMMYASSGEEGTKLDLR